MSNNNLIIALPNKGRLHNQTIDFLKECNLSVSRDNERQYQAKMKGIADGVDVVFQRARDIPKVVSEGRVDLGITGFDIFCETGGEARQGECIPVFPDRRDNPEVGFLPYGGCSLVLAVPDHWVDITSVSDLAELAINRKKEGRMLRVATEFPNLTKTYLFSKGVSYFEIIEVYGAAESTPKMGSADMIADLKSSGITLSENRLKEIAGGEILAGGACLIASKKRLSGGQNVLAREVIDRIEAHIRARGRYLVTANVVADNEDKLKNRLTGLSNQGNLTMTKALNLLDQKEQVFSVSIQVEANTIESVVTSLRTKGAGDILVSSLSFIYDNKPKAYPSLRTRLEKIG